MTSRGVAAPSLVMLCSRSALRNGSEGILGLSCPSIVRDSEMCWADLLVAFSIDIGAICVSSQEFACSVSEACRAGLAISSTDRLHIFFVRVGRSKCPRNLLRQDDAKVKQR